MHKPALSLVVVVAMVACLLVAAGAPQPPAPAHPLGRHKRSVPIRWSRRCPLGYVRRFTFMCIPCEEYWMMTELDCAD